MRRLADTPNPRAGVLGGGGLLSALMSFYYDCLVVGPLAAPPPPRVTKTRGRWLKQASADCQPAHTELLRAATAKGG